MRDMSLDRDETPRPRSAIFLPSSRSLPISCIEVFEEFSWGDVEIIKKWAKPDILQLDRHDIFQLFHSGMLGL